MDDPQLLACGIAYLLKSIKKNQKAPEIGSRGLVFDESRLKRYGGRGDFDTLGSIAPARAAAFCIRLCIKSRLTTNVFISALIYLTRLVKNGLPITTWTWRPMLSTAVLLADKFWLDPRFGVTYDEPHTGRMASIFQQLSSQELLKMEHAFLQEIEYRLVVQEEIFNTFCSRLRMMTPSDKITSSVESYFSGINRQNGRKPSLPLPA